jgi:redox-regulated HSP33 family molecular chaperone
MIPEARDEYEEEARQVGTSIAEKLGNAVNRHDKHQVAIGFSIGMLGNHRTLQQSAISALAEAMLSFAKESKDGERYDMRNEYIIKAILKHEQALREIALAPLI